MRLEEPAYISEKFLSACREYYALWKGEAQLTSPALDMATVLDSMAGMVSSDYALAFVGVKELDEEQLIYFWLFYAMHNRHQAKVQGAVSFLESQGFTPTGFSTTLQMRWKISKLIKSDFRNTIYDHGVWNWANGLFSPASQMGNGIPDYILFQKTHRYFMNWIDENPMEGKQ